MNSTIVPLYCIGISYKTVLNDYLWKLKLKPSYELVFLTKVRASKFFRSISRVSRPSTGVNCKTEQAKLKSSG